MVAPVTPNRALVLSAAAFVAYWIAAVVVPGAVLREMFNALAFGTAVVITITWFSAAARAMRLNAPTGDWLLVLGVFLMWLTVLMQRVYVIAFNWSGRPESWTDSALPGFFPYSFALAGMLFIAAPGVHSDRLGSRTIWAIIAAVALGSALVGFLFGLSISSS